MGDPFVVCPFNKSHRIMMSRLQSHLLKCIKSYSTTEPTICPFNSQHIFDASQILEHCIICPNIKDVLIPANAREDKNGTSTVNNSSKSVATMINGNSVHSYTDMKVEIPNSISPKRFIYEKSEISVKVPDVRRVKKLEKNKDPSQGVQNKNITSNKYHTTTSDTNSTNLNSYVGDELELLETNYINYGEIYRNLETLEEKENAIAREMQVLRQKEKNIEEEKKELIEILKSITVCMNLDNNQAPKIIAACNDKIDTYAGNNINKHDNQSSNNPNSELERKSSSLQNIKPFTVASISSHSAPGSSPNINNTPAVGRGIMRAYSQKQMYSNRMDQSQGYHDTKGSN